MKKLKLVFVPKGVLSHEPEVLKNLEEHGIEIEIDRKIIMAHQYAGRWAYLGPKKKAKKGPRKTKRPTTR
jgi:hypothetical protein